MYVCNVYISKYIKGERLLLCGVQLGEMLYTSVNVVRLLIYEASK
jgi:hypothetical protein